MSKPDILLEKALKIIAEKGWKHFELKDLSDEKVSLAEVYGLYPSRISLLEALGKRIDQTTLRNLDQFYAEESHRDRLFSIMMTRFDTIADLKPVIKSLWKDIPQDPITLLETLPRGLNSMSWILQAAGVDTTGIRGALRTKAFAVCYLATVYAWLGDDTPDMDETMATLDKNLQRLTNFPGFYEQ